MRKFTESLQSIKKSEKKELIYYNLFDMLKGLESERPGIKDRVWKWMCSHPPYGEYDQWKDVAFEPYNGRISFINLFYYGVGDEYPLEYLKQYPEELEHSKQTHPEAFKEGPICELRKDLNLIWYVYGSEMDNNKSYLGDSVEMFAVMVSW
jgi:hypothetical protein